MSRRISRVNDLLREEISRIIFQDLEDPRLPEVLSITRVDTSPDTRYAKVNVSIFGDDLAKSNAIIALTGASGFIHKKLRRQLRMQNIPLLRFVLDESIEKGTDMLSLIEEAIADLPPLPVNKPEQES